MHVGSRPPAFPPAHFHKDYAGKLTHPNYWESVSCLLLYWALFSKINLEFLNSNLLSSSKDDESLTFLKNKQTTDVNPGQKQTCCKYSHKNSFLFLFVLLPHMKTDSENKRQTWNPNTRGPSCLVETLRLTELVFLLLFYCPEQLGLEACFKLHSVSRRERLAFGRARLPEA